MSVQTTKRIALRGKRGTFYSTRTYLNRTTHIPTTRLSMFSILPDVAAAEPRSAGRTGIATYLYRRCKTIKNVLGQREERTDKERERTKMHCRPLWSYVVSLKSLARREIGSKSIARFELGTKASRYKRGKTASPVLHARYTDGRRSKIETVISFLI